jgi:hypothetical protein
MPKLALSPEEDKEEDDLEDTPLGPSDGMKTLNSYLFLFFCCSNKYQSVHAQPVN